jgi:phosphotransferase system  glucose/maltose/N-acetylglucosamine-specific IIC component
VTTLAVAAALLPAAVTNVAGMEFLQPAAVTVLGGLVSAAIVTGFVIPALYAAFVAGAGRPGPDGPGQARTLDLRDAELAPTATSSEGV